MVTGMVSDALCAVPQSRTQDRAHARDADLHLEEWQSRRGKTLNKIAPDPIFHFPVFHKAVGGTIMQINKKITLKLKLKARDARREKHKQFIVEPAKRLADLIIEIQKRKHATSRT